jgi:hypothetical protein
MCNAVNKLSYVNEVSSIVSPLEEPYSFCRVLFTKENGGSAAKYRKTTLESFSFKFFDTAENDNKSMPKPSVN